MNTPPENIKPKIEGLKRDLIAIFGRDDAVIRAMELKIHYLAIAEKFYKIRQFQSYEIALQYVCNEFFISETTAKRAIRFAESIGQQNGLTEKQETN